MDVSRRPAAAGLIAAAALALAGLAAAQTAAAAEPLPTPPTADGSWTARVLFPTAARLTPGGRVITQLRHYTSFSQGPSAYMVTGAKVVRGRAWVRIQLPLRPNGRSGWVPLSAMELNRTRIRIRVSTSTRTIQVLRAGKRIATYRAAVGTGGTPTPKGLFAVLDPVPTSGQLGPYILVLTAHSNVLRTFAGGDGIVGIHGWPTSSVLGQAVSHGCVRMSRDDVRALARFAKPGIPVQIV